jgi:hypothetical protein
MMYGLAGSEISGEDFKSHYQSIGVGVGAGLAFFAIHHFALQAFSFSGVSRLPSGRR